MSFEPFSKREILIFQGALNDICVTILTINDV